MEMKAFLQKIKISIQNPISIANDNTNGNTNGKTSGNTNGNTNGIFNDKEIRTKKIKKKGGTAISRGPYSQTAEEGNCAERVGAGAPVNLAAVMKYLAAEVLELADNAARDNKKTRRIIRIIPRHLQLAIRIDEELNKLLSGTTIAQGGVSHKVNIYFSIMSHKKCAIVGCSSRKKQMYEFPNPHKDKQRFIKWLISTGNSALLDLPVEKIRRRTICEDHFEEKYKLRKKLSYHTIPTLLLPDGDKEDAIMDKEDATMNKKDATINNGDATMDKEDATMDKEDETTGKEDATMDKEDPTINYIDDNEIIVPYMEKDEPIINDVRIVEDQEQTVEDKVIKNKQISVRKVKKEKKSNM
ncbi:hypothetical protein DBV15_12519 [Temnothorax longispinosus]|uniref:THAP-type domain-containing protein n=1 Tax=Temnothorax longispinosus TaxID=300112 RepID=A0A4S2KHP8_9HYME|nr:hypothetical protein DBV15_12519 [Temnothorax longispinosus]